ncbi:hypothetical protein BGZ57DRAFT_855434 [Hyaloscypha finlandica]|nr:hypothetical protein BGZ57DRAFT_855434 [Hyaloscypha finlandica]
MCGLASEEYYQMHHWIALVAAIEALLHSVLALTSQPPDLRSLAYGAAIAAASAMTIIIIASISLLRRHFYETFLRMHQFLAMLIVAESGFTSHNRIEGRCLQSRVRDRHRNRGLQSRIRDLYRRQTEDLQNRNRNQTPQRKLIPSFVSQRVWRVCASEFVQLSRAADAQDFVVYLVVYKALEVSPGDGC